jgi:hypothetical protein|tara:strand:- start:530 stop:700 length:171 start_codon:yes stop_codon:yes gene_type:complete
MAVKYGHLEVLKWASENGCPCPWEDEMTSTWAAEGAHEMMKWAIDFGIEFSDTVMS